MPLTVASILSLLLRRLLLLPVNNITALAFCIAWSDMITDETGEQLSAAGVNIVSSLLLSSHCCTFSMLELVASLCVRVLMVTMTCGLQSVINAS